ncbi:hypothetical protein FVW27_01620, partial [Desulfovibrio sp. XJ01]|nr:hypothetical protein [Nitratidesulfovibrio liaohensis]
MSDSAPRPEQPAASPPAATASGQAPSALPPSENPPAAWQPVQPAALTGLLQPYGDPTRPVRPGDAVGRVLDGTSFAVLGDTRAPLGIDLVTGELMARELGVLERVERPATAAAHGTPAAAPAPSGSAGAAHTLILRPLVTVSPDRLAVLADVHATDRK